MYVLKARANTCYSDFSDGYYTGATYFFQGEKYAVVERDIDEAKKYTSLKRAERAADSMLGRISNYVFDVEEFKE